eukprot:1141135-Pelagomonas_calceolata.AAC.5
MEGLHGSSALETGKIDKASCPRRRWQFLAVRPVQDIEQIEFIGINSETKTELVPMFVSLAGRDPDQKSS